ncbi:MAG: hypothetical protein RLZZ440_401 [Planctomycetota bacterium]|jgi:hypothetical protein
MLTGMKKFLALLALTAPSLRAANQTATVSQVEITGLPYAIHLETADMGSATLPTLQSFATGYHDGKWVFVAGRTNGLHNFTEDGLVNFPPEYQNAEIWVIDPAAKLSWSRSLDDPSSGVGASVFNALSATATESVQRGSTLYLAGGYLYDSGSNNFTTYSTLTALDLGGVVNWVQTGSGSLASHVRQTSDPTLQVTGGDLHLVNDRALLTFGQNFQGPYTPSSSGTYTYQVRAFDIVDDGNSLSIANVSASTPQEAFRRRDLNVVPLATGGGPALVALSGVFTETGGAWTVPVEISADGMPSMADPFAPGTFKQAMNGYNTSSMVLYSPSRDENHVVLLGGISLQTYESGTFVTDNNLPFTSQGSSIVREADGTYTQYYLGDVYPDIIDGGTGEPLLFGAESVFLRNHALSLSHGLIDLDSLAGPTLLGYVFGGIAAEQPNFGATAASNLLFEVWYTPVPEPGALGLLLGGSALLLARRRVFRRAGG